MEEMLKHLNEKNRKVSEFINKNSNILNNEIIQLESEVYLFNKIGDYTINKGYHPVYFKSTKMSNYYNNKELKIVDVHYIHVYDDNGLLKISIYYDGEGSMLSFMDQPYYELYNLSDVRKFL
ncbi:MAG: hypothetical protein IJ094_01585, partial [Bacilli bacterium]|nr:hypothetical protein [Bacilli bacterium]